MTTPVQQLLADIDAATPDTSPQRLRILAVRAKRMGRTDLLPSWLCSQAFRPAAATAQLSTADPLSSGPAISENALRTLDAKARVHEVPLPVLREVFYREMTSTSPLPPDIPRENAAHARVNTFLRLIQGDPGARTDDSDLLSKLEHC